MLSKMPSGAANRTRRQLLGAAAAAVAVCNLSGAVGEADQHLTARQQHSEEPRKRACTLRSHTRDGVEGRGIEQLQKCERFPPTQQSTPAALSGGKHQQQKEDQRHRQVQQPFSVRCTRGSKADAAARSDGEQLPPTKRLDSSPSTDRLSTVDAKESTPEEKPVQAAAATPVPTSGVAAPPAAARSACATSGAAPPAAATAERDEDACQNRELEDADHVGEVASNRGNAKLISGHTESVASSENQCQVTLAPTQRLRGDAREGENHQQQGPSKTGELASEETAKISVGSRWKEAPSLNKAEFSEKAQLTPEQGSRETASPPLEDDIRRAQPEATKELHPPSGLKKETTAAEELQSKRNSLSAVASDTLEKNTVQALSTRENSPLHQQASPMERAPFFENALQLWQRKATEGSDSSSSSNGKQTPPQEQPKVNEARQPKQDRNDAYQVASTSFELQASPQRMQRSQVVHREHLNRGWQLLLPKKEQQSDEEQKLLHTAQNILQRLEESPEPSQPPSSEDHQELRGDVGELDKHLSCAPGGAAGRQGQQVCRSEDIRFFLRLGGGETSPPRSVHVSSAFLKDSWRAQRFFCKLFGVDIGEVIGLVDEQGFVSPFDGEELFIRNGGTYTLELAHTRRGESVGLTSQNAAAAAFVSGRCLDQPALRSEHAAVAPPCDRAALSTRIGSPTAVDGGRAGWQQAFAAECIPVKNDGMAVLNREPSQGLELPSARAASSLYGQAAQQALCREEYSVAAAERAGAKIGAYGIVSGQQQSRMLQDVLLTSSNHMRLLPPNEQQALTLASGTCAASGSMRMREAHGKNFAYRGDDDGADTRSRKDVLIWAGIPGGTREMLEVNSASAGACCAVARSEMHVRSTRGPGELAGMADFIAQGIGKSETVIHGRGGLQAGVEGQHNTQAIYSRAGGQSLRGVQEAAEGGGGADALQRMRRGCETWQAAESPGEGSRRSSVGRRAAPGASAGRRVKQRWDSLSPTGHVEEGSSAGVTEGDIFVAEHLTAKRSKLEDDRLSSTSQHQLEGQRASNGPAFLSEHAAQPKKQQQSTRASKLWISAPLLVWRRRRLRRSLALHEPEDPAEVATRQLVAEQHVRAVLARVSQRKALRSHLQIGSDGAQEQLRDSDTSRLTRKGAGAAVSDAPRAQREGANKGVILSRPPRRNSALHGEPLLVDSLLWKKASTEKIYVHQTSSYGSATYAVKASAAQAEVDGTSDRVHSLPLSGDHQLSQQHEQPSQRHWRGTQSPHGRDTLNALTHREAAGVTTDDKMKEEGATSRFPNGTRDNSGPPRQYMLRPRLANTSIRPGAYLERKVHSFSGDSSSLQRRLVRPAGGTVGEDTNFNGDNFSLRPTLAGERQESGIQPSLSRRSSNTNTSDTSLVHLCDAQSRSGEDDPQVISRSEEEGFQGHTGRAEGSTLVDSRGSIEKNGTRPQASSHPEQSGHVFHESSVEGNGDGCEWKKQVSRSQRQGQQQFLQQVLEKQLFTSSELQGLLTVLETLKAPKQQQQQRHTLVDRLKVLLPPQTFNNLKLLLPSLLKTAERLTRTDAKDEEKPCQNRECGRRTSFTASQTNTNTAERTAVDCGNGNEKVS